MNCMSWFRRNNKESYMQNTQTVSRPVGIVLTILTILVIGAAIYVLFLGGRWVSQNLDGTNVPKEETVSADVTAEAPQDPNSNSANSTGSSTSGSSQAAGGSGPSTATPTGDNSSSSSQSNSIASTGPTASSNSSTTPAGSTIPATGPAEVITLFAVSTMLGLVAHNLYIRKKMY